MNASVVEMALKIHKEYEGRRMPRRIWCALGALTSPEGGCEKYYFRLAEGLYEQCEMDKNRSVKSHRARVRAAYFCRKAENQRAERYAGISPRLMGN